MRILLPIILITLSACSNTYLLNSSLPTLDYSKSIIACTNIYDSKDDIIYYKQNRNSFNSISTGVNIIQYTYEDVYGNKRMLNESEIQNYQCKSLTTADEYNIIVND